MPDRTPVSQCQYWTGTGLSRPFCLLKAAMFVGVACVPRIALAGPPGSRWSRPKTITDTSSSTTTAWEQRRSRNLVTA